MDVSAVLTVAAQTAGAASLVTVSSRAATWMREKARFRHQADAARELLGLHQGELVAYRHDSRHVLYTGTESLHPDNLHALAAASGNPYKLAEQNGQLVTADEVFVRSSHDLALIGSPTAEGVSRLLFGYATDGDPDSLALDQAPLDLPYRWVISKNEVDDLAIARRFVPGRGMVERPNWRIIGPDRMYVPRVDQEGVLLDDYLLVTRVRNYLSRGSVDEGNFIVSFGGTHGTGTRAVELLFKNQKVLGQVANQLRTRPAAFQLLFRVGDIKHDRTVGSHARSIELVEDVIARIAEDEIGLEVDVDGKRFLGQYVGRFKTEHERQDLSSGYAVRALSDEVNLNKAHFSSHRVIKKWDQTPAGTGAMYRFYLSLYFDTRSDV